MTEKSFFFFDFLASPGAPGGFRTKNSENYFYIQLNARRERERPTSGKSSPAGNSLRSANNRHLRNRDLPGALLPRGNGFPKQVRL